jgi:hypothetical protein
MAQPVIHVNGTLADVVDEVTREMVQQQLLIEIGPHLKGSPHCPAHGYSNPNP